MLNACFLSNIVTPIMVFIFLFFGNNVFACHNTSVSINSISDNGNGTYDISMDVCAGGLEETYGFELTINGADIISINTGSLNELSTITAAQISSNVVEYGDYNNTGTPIFNQGTTNCWTVNLTLDGYPTSVDLFGTELTFGFCGGSVSVPPPPPPPLSCGDVFYDPGGALGDYGNNNLATYTICPDVPGDPVTITFSSFNLENSFDYLYVWDDDSDAGPEDFTYTGTTIPGPITATNATGCLTVVFDSDGSVTSTGFEVTVSCIVTTCSADAGSPYFMCDGDSPVTLGADPVSPDEGATYSWSNGAGDGTLDFSGGGQDNGQVDVSPTSTTTYTLTVTNGACVATDDVTVTFTLPIADAGSDLIYCPTDPNIDIGADPVSPDEGATYSWSNGAGSGVLDLQGGGQDHGQGSVGPTTTTTYTLTVTTDGCVETDQMTVTIDESPTASNPSAVAVQCSGEVPAQNIAVIDDEVDDITANPVVTWQGDASSGSPCDETILRTYRVTDECGNFIDVTQTITVEDTEDPTGTAPAPANYECLGDVPAQTISEITNAADNCTAAPVVVMLAETQTVGCPIIITRQWSITDDCLNTITVTQTITVQDTEDPTGSAPAPANYECLGDVPAQTIAQITDEADNCTAAPVVVMLAETQTGICPIIITRQWSITDDCLNTITVTQTITVQDTEDPTGSAPAPANYECLGDVPAQTIAQITDEADNCTAAPVVVMLAETQTGICPIIITRQWSITDDCLNTITVTQTITVQDTEDPTASDPASITVAVGNVPPADPLVVIDEADNCDPNPTVTWLSDVSVIGVCLETNTRTYKVMDACDNFTEVEQIIIVEGIPPTITTSDMGVCLGGAIDITASGAGGTGTYSWSPGTELNTTTGATVTSTPTGDISYTVTGTDANGCVNTAISNVTVSGSAPINAGIDVSICTGETTTLTAIGGVTYTWDNSLGAGSTFSVSPTATTTYIVDGVDGSGCAGTDQITVTVNPLPTVAAGVDQIICEGTAVTLSGSGANTYVWDNAVTNNTPFTPGVGQVTYTVIGTDANGCVNTDDVEVTVNTLPTVAAGVDQTICEGPTVTLSGSGANTYVWDNGVDDGIAFIPGVGTITYTVTGTATNGCVNTDDVVVTINPIPNVNAGVDQAECEGTAITLVGSGAMDYVWNNGVIDNTAFTPGVGTVTYIVTGTDGNGCVNTDQVDVVINPNPTPTINGASDYCVGTFATLSTATPYITYFWTTGDVTPTSNVTIADNPISVLVTNAFGCSGVSVDWLVSENAVITYNSTETICQGDAILIHGVSQTVAAVYSETFILGTGCDSVSNVTLVVNPLPTVDTGIDQALCVGGDVTLTATGANTYAWDNSVINGVQFTPSVGTITYTVTGTDINGCENTDAVDVTVNALPIVDAGFDESICLGGNVTLTGSGAITYVWNNGVVENTAFTPTLGTVTYTVTGTDANLCVNTDAVEVTVNALPVVDAGVDQIICDGLMVTLSGSGADTYVWDNGVVDGIAFTPGVGTVTYMVTGTDGNGCIDSDDIIVQFSDLDFNNEVVSSTCGAANGEITLTGTNGIVNYEYSIDNGANFQASGNFIGLLADDYIVVVQDGLGCDATGLISVSNLDGPEINTVNPTPPTCFGESTGSISINATGATGFSIDNGATFQPSNVFLGLEDGTYLIAVENGIGCEAYSTIEIIDPAQLTFTTAPSHLSCNGVCIGEIEVNALGGTGTLQYSNDNGANFSLGNTFTNLCAGDYDMVVQDAIGCLASSIQIVTEPVEMKMTLGITNPLCNSSCDGLINSIPTGGDGNYTYIWSNGVTLPLLLNLCSGAYSLNIEDGNGCSIDTTVTLVGPAAAVITNVIEDDESCPGMCDGVIEIVASNATQYSIDGVNFVANPIFTNLCSGNYTVHAQDANECSTDSLVEVGSPIAVGVSVTATSPICIGGSSFLDGTVTGGNQPFTYEWSDNAGVVLFATEDGNVSPILDEVYTFTATDANGCTNAETVLVEVNGPLTVLSIDGDTPICEGSPSNLSASAGGGDGGPYTYTWDQGLGVGQNQTVTPTATTIYTVTITDGCQTPSISDQVTVIVNTVPTISFTGDELFGCVPVTTNFTDNLVPAGSTCLWDFGDGGTSTQCASPSYVFTQPGCWDVTLTITTAEGCIGTVTIPNYVCVFGYPTADFTFGPQPTSVLNPTIDFVNLSSNADAYNWTFDVGGLEDQSTVEDPQYTFPNANPGTYEVCLEAITLNGCTDTICQNVLIDEEFIIYVPNAFTPGGSDLINNEFKPIVKGEDPLKYSFMVFNRWGELIFETSHSSEGWDGTYKGLMSQQDVYVWKVTCIDPSSKQSHEYMGHVTLLK